LNTSKNSSGALNLFERNRVVGCVKGSRRNIHHVHPSYIKKRLKITKYINGELPFRVPAFLDATLIREPPSVPPTGQMVRNLNH
jgi:hypothetical protein